MKIYCVITITFGLLCIGYGLGTAPEWFTVTGIGLLLAFQGFRLLLSEMAKPKDKP